MTFALIVAVLMTGCDTAPRPEPPVVPPSDAFTGTPAPESAGTLVLRLRVTGGVAGRGGPAGLPEFSLYGDGRAIVPDAGGSGATGAREHRLTPAAYRRLLEEARAAGLTRPRRFADRHVADAFTYEITLDGVRTEIMESGHGASDPAVRFARRRLDPSRWPAGDQAAPARPYEPRGFAVMFGEDHAPDRTEPARRWPFTPLRGGMVVPGGSRCVVVGGPDTAAASRMARTERAGTRWVSEDRTYVVRFRPLLPDERGCVDVSRS